MEIQHGKEDLVPIFRGLLYLLVQSYYINRVHQRILKGFINLGVCCGWRAENCIRSGIPSTIISTRVMARISNGLDFQTPARLDPDFVGLGREMQRLPLDIAIKRKFMCFSTIICHILPKI